MSSCLHIMLICGSIIFLTLNNKNFWCQLFKAIFVHFYIMTCKVPNQRDFSIIIVLYIWWTMSCSTSKWSVWTMAHNGRIRKMVCQTGGGEGPGAFPLFFQSFFNHVMWHIKMISVTHCMLFCIVAYTKACVFFNYPCTDSTLILVK